MLKRLPLFLSFLLCCLYGPGIPESTAAERAVHVVVALCDNIHQRIYPVPTALGNGMDPARNLYWGAAYGVKTFMRKQQGWVLEQSLQNPAPRILERVILRHQGLKTTLVADAYEGSAIKKATEDFLDYCAGNAKGIARSGKAAFPTGGAADLVVYVGHNGLMDFSLGRLPAKADDVKRLAAVFACQSKAYFTDVMKKTGAEPLLWTRGNMAPEAYVLHALVLSWAGGKSAEETRRAVAEAYNRFQKCGMKGALGLFASGY